ncbi:BUB1 Checkpoint serine/threonine-protein kinase BUB1 [Candida maltosa Xu316]
MAPKTPLQPVDIEKLESQKENIQPLSGGRSVSKLLETFPSHSKVNFQQHKHRLSKEREQFEQKLLDCDELDDPLQVYIDYIDWTHYNYPQGANTDSGLLILLEKCTSNFRDIQLYKNDPRYLKVWLEYTNYSDSPRDIYVYLAKKEIGNQLALYYEEFASFLELQGKLVDANQIYELGIQSDAFPLKRLQRSYENFKQRRNLESNSISSSSDIVREVLALKRGSAVESFTESNSRPSKKLKLDVFKDDEQQDQSVLHSIFDGGFVEEVKLNPTKQRIKENSIAATTWKGQILKQKIAAPSNGSGIGKIPVFRDVPIVSETKSSVHIDDQNNAYTLIETVGKKTEKVPINMDLLYPDSTTEYSLMELLAIYRSIQRAKRFAPTQVIRDIYEKDETTKTITLGMNDTTTERTKYGKDPTITMNGNLANNELQNIYNDAAYEYNTDDEEEDKLNEPTVTNYDGYVTETLQTPDIIPTQDDHAPTQLDAITTPPTDKEDNSVMSSPFVSQPVQATIIDPFNVHLQNDFLNNLAIPMSTYSGYHDNSSLKVDRIRKFRDITNKNQSINKGSQSAIIDCCGQKLYCLLHELGRGGYGYVYLIEDGSNGNLKALKIESPASKWEFYILHQIHRRLVGEPLYKQHYFIRADSLYYFRDESFLILDYCSQSTLLDVVNNFKNQGAAIDECLVVFFTIELLKIVETLHSVGILHGDLKADNCMVRFESVKDGLWSEKYDRKGDFGWSSKSVTLIDFGRAVDLKLFPKNTRFTSYFKTDVQDCPQMNEGQPWTYEADYYGVAGIIHTILFGNYIKIKKEDGKIKLVNSFKRYWQSELWNELFDVLLNPYYEDEVEFAPKIEELSIIRQNFEDWLEKYSKPKYLKEIIKNVEFELNAISRARMS